MKCHVYCVTRLGFVGLGISVYRNYACWFQILGFTVRVESLAQGRMRKAKRKRI